MLKSKILGGKAYQRGATLGGRSGKLTKGRNEGNMQTESQPAGSPAII